MLSAFSPIQRGLIVYAVVVWACLRAVRALRTYRAKRAANGGPYVEPADLQMPIWERAVALTIYAVVLWFIAALIPQEIVPALRGEGGHVSPLVIVIVYGMVPVPLALLLVLRSWHAVKGRRTRVFGRHSHL
jgi:peptidoglycan biosynthesis protein MviN/MurJ (putative lipid II flippase)